MHNEQLHKLCFSSNIISAIKSEENRSQGRQRHRWEGNIKMDLKKKGKIMWTGFIRFRAG